METAPGIEMKPLQFWAASGQWAQLSRYQPGIRSDRHVHTGGQVMSYVIQGSWHYLEHDWVASAGSWVWEPPGDLHTLDNRFGRNSFYGCPILKSTKTTLDSQGDVWDDDGTPVPIQTHD